MNTRKLKVKSRKWKVRSEGQSFQTSLPLFTFHFPLTAQFQSPLVGLFLLVVYPPMNADLDRLIRLQQLETDGRRGTAEDCRPSDARAAARRATPVGARQRGRREGAARRRPGTTPRRREGGRHDPDAAREIQGSAARSEDQPRIPGDASRDRGRAERHPHARRPHPRDHDGVRRIERGDQEERGGAQGHREGCRRRCEPCSTPSWRTCRARSTRPAQSERRSSRRSTGACLASSRRPQRAGRASPSRKRANGLCTICHVRLRPQVFNEVRKNESIIQCDSCRRILYFVDNPEAPVPVPQL